MRDANSELFIRFTQCSLMYYPSSNMYREKRIMGCEYVLLMSKHETNVNSNRRFVRISLQIISIAFSDRRMFVSDFAYS
ncbi:unnamed protein product [Auanema sp. JU1783]|nr:unnamed protein product [Auanema sp. JU1783]